MTGLNAAGLRDEASSMAAAADRMAAEAGDLRDQAALKLRLAAAVETRDNAVAATDQAERRAGAALAAFEASAAEVSQAAAQAAEAGRLFELDKTAAESCDCEPGEYRDRALKSIASGQTYAVFAELLAEREQAHQRNRAELESARQTARAAKTRAAQAEAAVSDPPVTAAAEVDRIHDLMRREVATRRPQPPGLSSITMFGRAAQ